jgi:hypothetical protein
MDNGRGSRVRTRGLRFWRPPLYQLSYTPVGREWLFSQGEGIFKRRFTSDAENEKGRPKGRPFKLMTEWPDYSMIEATMPAPTVLPPSRMAKRSFSSIAIGTMRVTSTEMLSPGITISVPSGNTTTPVTSVVRK